jgi:hypothetical protein
MTRCAAPARRALSALLLTAAAVTSAIAQQPRAFPPTALRGELLITNPPEVQLNGQPARLSPGARIRGSNNLIQVSGAAIGQRQVVHYTLDGFGQLRDVWVLTAEEQARKPWPTTPQEAQSWRFDAATQTWTRP